MSESYIQNLFAQRIGGNQYGKSTAIYKFEKIKRAKRAALAANPGAEIIDMGVGEPDEMAFPEVVAELHKEASKPENRGYADNGDNLLKQAAARYMEKVCGVPGINPDTEVMHSIGSKAALSILPAVLINPGDYVLMTTPGYPVFGTHAKYYGGLVHNIPLTEANNFLPDLKSIPADVLSKSKVLVINYPNNPTGASATPEFFAEVVAFAKKNNIVVIHDAAYAALVFEGKPLSFLATPGAKEVGIELHSTSKTFNMTGWRCGFVAGNELLVKAYGDVKDNKKSRELEKSGKYNGMLKNHLEGKRAGFFAHGNEGGADYLQFALDKKKMLPILPESLVDYERKHGKEDVSKLLDPLVRQCVYSGIKVDDRCVRVVT